MNIINRTYIYFYTIYQMGFSKTLKRTRKGERTSDFFLQTINR